MKLFLRLVIAGMFMLAFSSFSGSKKITLQELNTQVKNILNAQIGSFAVAFKNIGSNEMLLINEHENFHAASTMKTPVMIEVFKQANEGKFSLNDSIIVKNEFRSIADSSFYSLNSSDDSEQELYKHIGEKRTINSLIYDMIIVSSNLATNIIIDLVNAKNVMLTMQKFGAKDIQVLRGVEDNKAFEKGLNNTTTAYDLMLLFDKMARGKAVSKKASESMIEILLNQKFNEIIPARLPRDVRVAHKTGFITGVHHDSGIVFLPDGKKYVLVLLSKGWTDETKAIDAMAAVSEVIYKYVEQF